MVWCFLLQGEAELSWILKGGAPALLLVAVVALWRRLGEKDKLLNEALRVLELVPASIDRVRQEMGEKLDRIERGSTASHRERD